MKKLVCLMLVALICTVASAATVKFNAAGATGGVLDVMPGTLVEVSVIADYDVASIVLTIGADGGTAAAKGVLNSGFLTMPNAGNLRNGKGILIDRISGSQGLNPGDTAVAAGQSLYTFTFVAPDVEGLYTISSVTGAAQFTPPPAPYTCVIAGVGGQISLGTVEALGINVIPEPMTVALLGLGGLFIRRRK